jgi:hypothetical protein
MKTLFFILIGTFIYSMIKVNVQLNVSDIDMFFFISSAGGMLSCLVINSSWTWEEYYEAA